MRRLSRLLIDDVIMLISFLNFLSHWLSGIIFTRIEAELVIEFGAPHISEVLCI